MRPLALLTAIPVFYSVYVAGDNGYDCSDSEGNTNTTYDQALVEGSVKDTCLPDSELSAAELAANVEAKKYPQVWVDSKDYGFNGTVLLWKYQGNSSEALEELDVLIFTDSACNVLGLAQKSKDFYTICKSAHEHYDEKVITNTLHKHVRRGFFSNDSDDDDDDDEVNNLHGYQGSTSENAITLSPIHESRYENERRRNRGWSYFRTVPKHLLPDPPATLPQEDDDTSSYASTEYGTASQSFSTTNEDDSSQYNEGSESHYGSQYQGGSSSSYQRSKSKKKGFASRIFGSSQKQRYLPATADFPSTRNPPPLDRSRERPSGWVVITPGPPSRPPPNNGYTMRPHRPNSYGPEGTIHEPDDNSGDPPYIPGNNQSSDYGQGYNQGQDYSQGQDYAREVQQYADDFFRIN
ncbi:BgtE-5645 [Blumeria graminis f. sp. tritici]|uniref:BgtE-5645 n=2 Tax=Blumeria graminis f. sp. tritici TaxID=62690 RepID=A0A381L8Z8_BLUGR|nr:putative secreted effector protein [Blumeria graminis f. sp. tritici 96224]VDB85929.1 BgtE-5645 [Blumeria graminis f. sp. tritici]